MHLSQDPGGSFQDTVGYPQRICPFIRTLLYSLQNIRSTFSLVRTSRGTREEEVEEMEGKRRILSLSLSLSFFWITKACVLVFCVVCTCIYAHALWRSRELEGRVDVSTKASRFSRLICCYSCLRREDRPIPLDPQTFIMFFCNTSTNATGIAAFTRHPARSSRDLYFACIRPVCTPVFINRGKKKGWITEGCRCASRAEGNVNDISREEVRNNILILLI